MSDWKPGDMAFEITKSRNVQLRDRFKNMHGSYKWAVADGPLDPVNGAVYECDLFPLPARSIPAIPTLAENQARLAAKVRQLREVRTPPIEQKPNPGIKRDFEEGGLTGNVEAKPSFVAIGQGVILWCRMAPRNRRVTLEAQGDLVLATVESFPSRVHARVVFTRAETVNGVLDTLDRAFAKAGDQPYSPTADPVESLS